MAVTLTERAAQHISRHLLSSRSIWLRLSVRKSGCSGFAYDLRIEENAAPDDMVCESFGVRVLVDAQSLPYVDGTHIDYAAKGLNRVFSFDNPNVKAACGCGESFTV